MNYEDMLDGVWQDYKDYEQSDTFRAVQDQHQRDQRLIWAKAMRDYNHRYPQARLLRAQAAKHRDALYEQQGGACYLCHQSLDGDVTIDHIVSISRGGTSALSNLCVVHLSCNAQKGSRAMSPEPAPIQIFVQERMF